MKNQLTPTKICQLQENTHFYKNPLPRRKIVGRLALQIMAQRVIIFLIFSL